MDEDMQEAHGLITSSIGGSTHYEGVTTVHSRRVQVQFIETAFAAVEPALAEEVRQNYLTAATDGSAGLDLRYLGDKPLGLAPGESQLVNTGLAIYLKDPGLVGLCMPRSGRGNEGLVLGNLTGVIDADYQGEIKLCLWNRLQPGKTILCDDGSTHDPQVLVIEPGERIAQYFAVPREQLSFEVVDAFDTTTERGTGGFGSSGRF